MLRTWLTAVVVGLIALGSARADDGAVVGEAERITTETAGTSDSQPPTLQPPTIRSGSLHTLALPSKFLGRDLPVVVYVPPGYDQSSLHYPVLYLLHGAGGDENAWVTHGRILEKTNRLIGSGHIPPAIVVMPGCVGCWWIDGAVDRIESAFWGELVPQMAKRFRVIDRRAGRLIAGLSAGGYGTVRYAMRYPDRVAAVAALSPAVYADTPPAESSARSQPPFLDSKGQFSQASWSARNYTALMPWYLEQAQRVRFYLVSGDEDRFGIAYETALLFKQLFDAQPREVELRIVDGDHTWAVWENSIDAAMRYLFRFAAKPEAPAGHVGNTTPIAFKRR